MAARAVLPDPGVEVAQDLIAARGREVGEPCRLIGAPDEDAAASAEAAEAVVELVELRDHVALPPARVSAARRTPVHRVAVTEAKLRPQRLARLDGTQWEAEEVPQQLAVHENAGVLARHVEVGIAEDVVSPGVGACIAADAVEDVLPVGEAGVVSAHELGLAEVNRLIAGVDVARAAVEEPEAGLKLGDVRDRAAGHPEIAEATVGIEHRLVAEVAALDRQAELLEDPRRNGDVLHAGLPRVAVGDFRRVGRVGGLENAGLQHDAGVDGVDPGGVLGRDAEVLLIVGGAVPGVGGPADEHGARLADEAQVVCQVRRGATRALAADAEELDRTGEVVLEHFQRDPAVEVVLAFLPRRTGGQQHHPPDYRRA